MSAAQTLSSIPFVEPVAWALVHSVWQGGLLALALAAALSLLRGKSPGLRYAAALAAFLALPALVLLTAWRAGGAERELRLVAGRASGVAPAAAAPALRDRAPLTFASSLESQSAAAPRDLPAAALQGQNAAALGPAAAVTTPTAPARGAASAFAARAGAALRPALPWLFAAWLCGVAALSLAQLAGWLDIYRRRHRRARPLAVELGAALPRLCERLGIRRAVTFVESAAVAVPAVVGWLRPLVLVPASALAGLTPQQLELVLAHELAHVRRHDYLVNLLQALVETLFFFHPAAWWMSHQVRREREHCCDDLAVAVCGDRLEYARALATLEGLRTIPLRLAPAATGPSRGVLLARIRRLVAPAGGAGGARAPYVWLPGALGLTLLALSAAAPLFGFAGIPGFTHAEDQTSLNLAPTPPSLRFGASAAPPEAAPPAGLGAQGSAPDRIAAAAPVALAGRNEQSSRAGVGGSPPAGAPEAAAEVWRGEWTAERERDRVMLEMNHTSRGGRSHWSESFTLPAEQLVGFDRSEPGAEAHFELRRDAGTFAFTGKFEGSGVGARGAGFFTFRPDPRYAQAMAAFGYKISEDRSLELAVHDISLRFVGEIHDLGYRDISLDRLVEFKIHGVTAEFIRALAAHGYRALPAERLVEFRIHGVTPEFVQGLGAEGYREVPAERLVEFRIHGVSPEFVRGLAAAGYRDVPTDRLVELRIHGVTPEFVHELVSLGYRDVPVERLVEFKIHGVTAETVRELNALGYRQVPADRLVEFGIHGVSAAYLKELGDLGYRQLEPERLVEFRIHGVSADYLRELAAAGYPHVDAESLVAMRIHGVDGAFIRDMAARGYHDLSPEELVSLRIHGPDRRARRPAGK